MTKREQLSVGLIGCGVMGRTLVDSFHKMRDARVVAVCDPLTPSREGAARAYEAPAYADYRELLARPDIGAVVIAAPNHLHRDLAIAAAAAGKHIFCEKPMALSLADCDQMIDAAASAGVKLMVGQVLRLMFPFSRMKELATEGALGLPVCVDICRLEGPPRIGWRARRDLAGGLLFEMNVHELDLMRHLCGEVQQVSAYGGHFVRQAVDYADVCQVNLLFRSGAVGHLHAGCAGAIDTYQGIVICPTGTLSFGPEWLVGRLQRDGADEAEMLERVDDAKSDGIDWEVASFVAWVLRDEPPVVTAFDGRAAVELAEAAYLSMDQGGPVDLPLNCSHRTTSELGRALHKRNPSPIRPVPL